MAFWLWLLQLGRRRRRWQDLLFIWKLLTIRSDCSMPSDFILFQSFQSRSVKRRVLILLLVCLFLDQILWLRIIYWFTNNRSVDIIDSFNIDLFFLLLYLLALIEFESLLLRFISHIIYFDYGLTSRRILSLFTFN